MAATPPRPEPELFRPDPAVRTGVLPNGLRYVVQHNAMPKGAVSLRLAIDVGSYEEAEAERGFAHFIEHMAFRSTRSFPDGAPDREFAPWGVAFGRDQNAATTLFATTFKLDMPQPDAAQVRRGLVWLRDAADGIVFTADAVGRERGVILAEKEMRNDPMAAAQEAIGRFQAPELRSANRSPIGLQSTIEAAGPDDLKRFYLRWYRPDQAIVTAVGDMPPAELEQMVRDAFSTWSAQGPKPQRARATAPDQARPLDAFTIAGPTLPSVLSVCRLRPGEARGQMTLARLQGEAQSQIWREILNKRLLARAASPDAGLLTAGMAAGDLHEAVTICVAVAPTGDAWAAGLASARAELDRFAKDGPTEAEAEAATDLVRAHLRGDVLAAGARASRDLADGLQSKALEGLPLASPADVLYDFDRAVEDLTPETLRARFAVDWSGSQPRLAMAGAHPPTREQMLAAWSSGPAVVTAPATASRSGWAYSSFGKPGKVVSREVMAEGEFVRLKFANGVILNFKGSAQEPNKVAIRLSFGRGRQDLDDRDLAAVQLGANALTFGGLGKHSFEEIQALLASKLNWMFEFGVGPSQFGARSLAFSNGVEDQLQVLAAFLSDPGFRPEMDARLPTLVDMMFRSIASRPEMALNVAMAEQLDPGSPGNMPSRDVAMALKARDLSRALRPALVGSQIEVTLVGDLDEASATHAVAATFGALPPRAAPGKAGAPRFFRYPDVTPPAIRIEHEGPADKAVAILVWPLYVSTPERRREEYSLKLLAAVFDTALRRRIRDDLGKTYAPRVFTTGPDFGDQGALQVSLESTPADLPTIVEEARKLAAELQAGGVSARMLEDAREPILADARARKQTDMWWADTLSGSARQHALLEEGLQYEPLMTAITLEDVRAAARTWLARAPIVGEASPHAPASGGTR